MKAADAMTDDERAEVERELVVLRAYLASPREPVSDAARRRWEEHRDLVHLEFERLEDLLR